MIPRSVLITGCSSGIGLACAKGLKAQGWRVFATARRLPDIAMLNELGVEALYLDYTEPQSIHACIEDISLRTGGKLYALFNSGTYGQPGAVEDLTRAALTAQFEASLFGWHELTRACLPLMRANGSGRVVNCSSVLGLVALKYRGAYCASKFAIEAVSDALRLELADTQIRVVLIEPGPILSRFTEHALKAFDLNIDVESSHYKDDYVRQRARLQRGGKGRFKLPPEAVLAKLVKALDSPNPRRRYYVTVPTYVMAWARRILPGPLLDRALQKASK